VAKIAKRSFFVLFATFCHFCFPEKEPKSHKSGGPQNPMRSAAFSFQLGGLDRQLKTEN
jgi:hypothetical protein